MKVSDDLARLSVFMLSNVVVWWPAFYLATIYHIDS